MNIIAEGQTEDKKIRIYELIGDKFLYVVIQYRDGKIFELIYEKV